MANKIMVANPAAAYSTGRQNALREALLQTQYTAQRQNTGIRQENQQWNREVRTRTRQKWRRQDREQAALRKIDLTKPFSENKPWILRLPADKQKTIIDYYANNDEQERKRHADFLKLSQSLGARILPMVKDDASYQAARQAIFQQIQASGLVKPDELPELEKMFPAQYDPQWVDTRLRAYGYKPNLVKVTSGTTLYNTDTGKPQYTAPPKQTKATAPPTAATAVKEIAKAQEKIARLAQTGGFDYMQFLVATPEERKTMLGQAQLNPEAKKAVQYYTDVIDYYKQFAPQQRPTATNESPKQVDWQARYNELRDSGLSKADAAAQIEKEMNNANP